MNAHSSHSLPSPDYTGDSDSECEIIKELEQKRRELDEEVARFQAQKEYEFKQFEADLKVRRNQKRGQQHAIRHNATNYYEFTKNSPSATPPTDSGRQRYEKKSRSPTATAPFKQLEPISLMKPHCGLKVTPPTICLDKMNITSELAHQPHIDSLQKTPTPKTTSIHQQSSGGQKHGHVSTKSAHVGGQDQPRNKIPISPENHMHSEAVKLNGLFVSGFLPTFDSRDDISDRQIEGTQTEPASPTGPSMIGSVTVHASSLPTESSLSEPLQMPQTKRAYTSPSSSNRTRLAPIIRNSNGRNNSTSKRKHVTFQLADRAIVEPSSSYEEGPSPEIDEDDQTGNAIDSSQSNSSSESLTRPKMQRKKTPMDQFGRRKRQPEPQETLTEEVGMSMGDLLLGSDNDEEAGPTLKVPDGYFSPRHDALSPDAASPTKPNSFTKVDENAYISKRKTKLNEQRNSSRSPKTSPTTSRQPSLEDTRKASPKLYQSPRFNPTYSPITRPSSSQYPGTLEDDLLVSNSNVGFFELDEELRSPDAGVPKPEFLDELDEEIRLSRNHSDMDLPSRKEIQPGSSVPINIIKSGNASVSNSWIGTFGH